MIVEEDITTCVLCNGQLHQTGDKAKKKCNKCQATWTWDGKAWNTQLGK